MDQEAKIALISPNQEFTKTVKEYAREQGKNMAIYTGILDEGVEIAREVDREGIDVIISRGATGALIRSAVSVPVVLVENTDLDVIEALHKAKQIDNKIAFFEYWHRKDKYDFERIKRIVDLDELRMYYYKSQIELRNKIIMASEDECRVVVASGICIINQALTKGMKGVLISSSKEAIHQAYGKALEIVAIRKRDQQIMDQLKTIIKHSFGAIIALDGSGRITHYNSAAKEALGIPMEKVVGQVIYDLYEEKELQKLYSDGEPVHRDLQQIHDKKYVVSRLPLRLDNVNFGLVITFEEVKKIQSLEAKIRQELYTKGLVAKYNFSDIIGISPLTLSVIETAKRYSKSDATVLITGESGTGKELFTQSIHQNSMRNKGPFVAVNCAAIPENLLESELFGYEEGAFTGAKKGGNPGLFEIAHEGTLFLDEILELPLPLQARILRALQEKAIRRVGGYKTIPVDVRIIAAANKSIPEAVRKGTFREDLYYRINVLNLEIPPLRERTEDIPVLIKHFLRLHDKGLLNKKIVMLQNYVNKLQQYHWPGNIRELENFVEKFSLLAKDEPDTSQLTQRLIDELYKNCPRECVSDSITIPLGTMKEMEIEIISQLKTRYSHNKELIAQKLGLSRTTIWKKLKDEM